MQHPPTGTGNAGQNDKCPLWDVSWMISFYVHPSQRCWYENSPLACKSCKCHSPSWHMADASYHTNLPLMIQRTYEGSRGTGVTVFYWVILFPSVCASRLIGWTWEGVRSQMLAERGHVHHGWTKQLSKKKKKKSKSSDGQANTLQSLSPTPRLCRCTRHFCEYF